MLHGLKGYLATRSPVFWGVAVLLLVGVWLRLHGLATHFGHMDDLVVPHMIFVPVRGNGLSALWAHTVDAVRRGLSVYTATTYAPLPFPLTAMLSVFADDYRSTLYWSRLPAALAGIGTLVLTALLLARVYGTRHGFALLMPLALLVFAWPHIIYSQQAEAYTMGGLGAALLMLLLAGFLKGQVTWRRMVGTGVAAGLLFYGHYQIMLFYPAFFAVCLMALWRTEGGLGKMFVGKIVAGGVAFGLVVLPLVLQFVKLKLLARGANDWNAGPHGEYLFKLPHGLDAVPYTLKFFGGNVPHVVGGMLAFVPEMSVVWWIATPILTGLAGLGLVLLLRSGDRVKKAIGLFAAGVLLTWVALVLAGKLTMGPTRHSLIFAGLFVVLIAAGLEWVLLKLEISRAKTLQGVLLGLVTVAFFADYPQAYALRRDPFDAAHLQQVLREHGVGTVITLKGSYHLSAMRHELVPQWAGDNQAAGDASSSLYQIDRKPFDGLEIAVLSGTPFELTPELFDKAVAGYGINPPMLRSDYEQVLHEANNKDVQTEWTRSVVNGSNGYELYILRRK